MHVDQGVSTMICAEQWRMVRTSMLRARQCRCQHVAAEAEAGDAPAAAATGCGSFAADRLLAQLRRPSVRLASVDSSPSSPVGLKTRIRISMQKTTASVQRGSEHEVARAGDDPDQHAAQEGALDVADAAQDRGGKAIQAAAEALEVPGRVVVEAEDQCPPAPASAPPIRNVSAIVWLMSMPIIAAASRSWAVAASPCPGACADEQASGRPSAGWRAG